VPPFDRDRLRLPSDRPLFLFVFDHHSTAVRKNPRGLIDAFAAAFPDGHSGFLLIKSINAATLPEVAAELGRAASRHPAVRVVDATLTASERLSLLATCDCYVSLHRSEGFGMTIAEAMAYGRPVIATGYGGTVDFLDDTTGYLVDWKPTRVAGDNSVYPADGTWADPDLDHAAALMREVAAAPRDAQLRGARAAKRIATAHAPLAVGRALAGELARLEGGHV
jgi:glycosyltransferase involved in cell wall biosynthesis